MALPMQPFLPSFVRSRATLATILAVVALGAAVSQPLQAAAAGVTTASAEASLLAWTNRDRAALAPAPAIRSPAGRDGRDAGRGNLAGASTFSHAAAGGDLAPAFVGAGVQWYAWGENIARGRAA